ncbi:MAG: nuclear transport factor 2 family protein [Acidimicrobiales bacterium]|nr:nuclear transport factor 2 family protein [Acidimicrobiales bacterium]
MADFTPKVREFFDTWKKGDVEGLVAFFAPDGTWQEANRGEAKGALELRPVFEMQVGFGTDFDFQYRLLAQVDNQRVVTERVDSWTYEGVRMTVEVMGVFEFDANAKITRFRDYYDWADLAAQLTAAGVDLTGV